MSQTFSILIYISLAFIVVALWLLTKSLNLGKRLAVIGLFGWMVVLMWASHFYDYWVWYYNMHNAEAFVRIVAEDRQWFGEDADKREKIIGTAFARPSTMSESSDNLWRALREAGINYGQKSQPQTQIQTNQ